MTKDTRSGSYDCNHTKSCDKKRTNQNKPEQKQQQQRKESFFSCVVNFVKGAYNFGRIVAPAFSALIVVTSELNEKGYFRSPVKFNITNGNGTTDSESKDNSK